MGGNKTQDGLSLKDILKVALQAGLEVRQGTKHPYNLSYRGMRPCPIATSTHAKRMLVPWMAQALGRDREELYQALKRGYLH